MQKHLIASLLLLAPLVAGGSDEHREFTLDIPAGDIQTLRLDANVGEVDIRAADVDAVEIRARLEPGDDDWFDSADTLAERLAEAELEHDISRGTLSLRLEYDDSGDGNDLEEHWEIRLPARLATDMELNVGSAEIHDTSGGVKGEVNVGELHIEVVRGDIDARVNVGEVAVRSATASPGEFDLEANIGEARLRIDGKDAGETEGWLGKGVSHDGGGEDDVTARVNVGDVRVEIRR